MNRNTSLTSRPLHTVDQRVQSVAQLRAQGVSAARAAAQCRPGGPWQQLLPGVYVLHQGQPSTEERLHAALLYAGRPPARRTVPEQGGPGQGGSGQGGPEYGEAMVTGPAALALYGFCSAPPPAALHRIDILVPRTRRLRSTRFVQVVRAAGLPRPVRLLGVPVAPVERALADAVAGVPDAAAVRRMLTEAVRGGHCEPAAVVRELSAAKLLGRAHVVDAVDALLAEGRAVAEGRLYGMVHTYGLPEPVWNVVLRLPGGPVLGGVDAYWPEEAVAIELDTRAPRREEAACPAEREHLERLGITVIRVTPAGLREVMGQQAVITRTALMAAQDREPAAYVMVLPR